ncbi:RCC1 domain-containing protein, alpha-tubulin suppressor, partial [Candidatus Magnetomorum sp. HK-1]
KNDGTVWGWGYNVSGQLGDGTTTQRSTAVQVSGLNNIIAISTGYSFAIALKDDGTVWAWGSNAKGQLGDGTTNDSYTPVQVSGLTDVISISCSSNHCLALKNDGTVWAWGDNQYGQLGDNSNTERHTTVQVSGLSGIISIDAPGHSIALKNDGTVWTWGGNTCGQLGDGTTNQSNVPIQITSVTNVNIIGSGASVTLMMKNDGTVWSCGCNTNGYVGDGTTTNRSTPVQILSDSTNYYPVISLIADQNIDEDTSASINFISSDLDSSACSMTITITSSNQSLLPDGNLSYACEDNHYTLTATPVSDSNGTATISIQVEDTGALTASRSFDLTVTAINDPPVLGTITGQTTNEDTPIHMGFTASDLETVDCNSLDISMVSSNVNLIPVENISYTCSAGNFYLSMTPATNQSGNANITITITDAGSLTATQSFSLTVNAVNDAP